MASTNITVVDVSPSDAEFDEIVLGWCKQHSAMDFYEAVMADEDLQDKVASLRTKQAWSGMLTLMLTSWQLGGAGSKADRAHQQWRALRQHYVKKEWYD